ncbi:MAG TPA: DUF3365 domain-containing protein [Pirellulales bacterium]|nr:DUF3365 domain-containing protein [Pirellulales bacterium]
MLTRLLTVVCIVGIMSGAFCVALALCDDTPGDAAGKPFGGDRAGPANEDDHRVSVAMARERAELMHRIYAATLDVMHDRYFHNNRAVVPARAMQDVFAEIERQSKVEARWISVNTRAMSLDHEPRTEFEKAAAEKIGAGQDEYEIVENGYYRRAGAITLGGGCVNCHTGFFKAPPKSPRFAGLVISVPVIER